MIQEYNNTTDLPDALIAYVYSFALRTLRDETRCPELSHVHTLTAKNKQQGKWAGQWGWYYPGQKPRIVLIVPRRLRPIRLLKRFSKRPIVLRTRSEWLVATIAHELRHHWQQHSWSTTRSAWKLRHDEVAKLAREIDAELFEIRCLEAWRSHLAAKREEVTQNV